MRRISYAQHHGFASEGIPRRDAYVRRDVHDNQGYRLRGYQSTNTQGIYHLETVVPGEYPGRTPHIHPPGGTTLTTQPYMPGVASNNRDSIFTPATVMK
jgi:protocatechuate 3,4-dioxygenase beta subunit